MQTSKRPNVLFVLADQWRAQACGYAGDPNVRTPHLDAFAAESVNFTQALSGCPVCSPYRASLMTGQYPNVHGMVVNELCLPRMYDGPYLAERFAEAGYRTAYIGKWHLDGRCGMARTGYVPPDRRLGFAFWRALEVTHDYNDSPYFDEEGRVGLWEGYDAEAQTAEAARFLRACDGAEPFLLFLSWGPPHNPYDTAPQPYRDLYDADGIRLPENVYENWTRPALAAEFGPTVRDFARKNLAGYYAHCTALDACFGQLLQTLRETGLDRDTIVVFTSDHGDMLGCQGERLKQVPWEESIRVPLLVRDPRVAEARSVPVPLDAPDLFPTLLGLCEIEIPAGIQGRDYSEAVRTGESPPEADALLASYVPFNHWVHRLDGREFRGIRTLRHTYVRDLDGPWLLYDNEDDPLQLENLCGKAEHAALQKELDRRLDARLAEVGDDFPSARACVERRGLPVGEPRFVRVEW